MKNKRDQSPDAAEFRRQAEAKLSECKKKAAPPPATEAVNRGLAHELEVHQIELEMQIAELVQARAQTEAALREYADLYDFAPVGYFALARDGGIRQINLAGANLLGVARSELINRRFGVFVSVESRPIVSAFLERIYSGSGNKETCEVALLKDGSDPLWAHMEASTVDGQECHAVVVEITERKLAEEALFESEARYRAVVHSANDGIISADSAGNIRQISRKPRNW